MKIRQKVLVSMVILKGKGLPENNNSPAITNVDEKAYGQSGQGRGSEFHRQNHPNVLLAGPACPDSFG
jgi:hypothetical protein